MANQSVAYKDYTHEIQTALRSCELQQRSLLKKRQGTPACTRVKQLRQMQREENRRERNDRYYDSLNHSNTVVIEDSHEPQNIVIKHAKPKRQYKSVFIKKDPRKDGVKWNDNLQRYCMYDDDGFITSCE